MSLHLHISYDTAEPRQTSFTNTPRKINFLFITQLRPEEGTVTNSFLQLCHPFIEVKFLIHDMPQTISAVN